MIYTDVKQHFNGELQIYKQTHLDNSGLNSELSR